MCMEKLMSRHQTLPLDVDDEEMLKSLSIGDGVTVTVRGVVKAISAPRENTFDDDGPDEFPGDISVDVESLKIVSGRNTFTELEEDGDKN